MRKNQKGFTLIELLVVVAIIGILATLGIVSLNSARAKARDAKRLSDVKQFATALQLADIEVPSQTVPGCVAKGLTTTCTSPFGDLDWTKFLDPSASATACTEATAATCGYSLSAKDGVSVPKTDDFAICFHTESASAIGPVGTYAIIPGGTITATCPY